MKEPIFVALLFVFSLSVFAHDSITKLKVSENRTIRWDKNETNESTKLTKDVNPTNSSVQMSFEYLSTNVNNMKRNKRDTPCIPGKKPFTKQITKNTEKNHTVTSIIDSLNQGTANIKYSSDPNVILILGLSGAGKSTLTQYLFGNNSNLMAVAKRNIKCQATGDFYIEHTGKKIGHDVLLSHTELPDLVIDPETNTTIYDCPGFSDTRDPEHDISGAYFIKAVSDRAKALKFIFVVNYNSITIGANREDFIILARHATNMINNISKYNESIALVATKIKDDKSDEQRIIAITDFLQDVRQTLNETNTEPNVQSFIDILLTTSGPDNQDYTRIACTPKFDKKGRLIDLTSVQDHKKSILSVIHNNTKFTKIDAIDVKPAISSDSVAYIDGLVTEVTKQMWTDINNVVRKVQIFYDDLIRNMQDTIHSFNDTMIVVDTDQLQAEFFLTKLNEGSSVISEVVKNIKNKTTLIELSKYIISSAMISEVDLSQDIVSNISTQHEYLKFLLSVHEPKDSFNVDSVITLFTSLENQLEVSINHFHNYVSDVANQIYKKILPIDNIIMNEIHKNFSSFAESNLDNKKIFSLMNSGHLELLEIRNLANGPDTTYKCINQIRRTINHFNFKGTNIKSVDHIIQNTLKLVDQLHFLQTLKDDSVNSNSLKCTDEINRVISYLDDLRKWYGLLIILFEKLSGYTVQTNADTCNDLSKSIMSHKPPARARDVIPRSFAEKCSFANDYNTAGVDDVILDKFKLDALKRIINHTLSYNSSYSCDLKSPDHLVMKGHYIRLSDLNNCLRIKNASLVEIFALKKIFIDADIDKTGDKFSLCIIAPIWEIHGSHKIKLDGKLGDDYPQREKIFFYPYGMKGIMASLNDYDKPRMNGVPGLPGGPGGNFLGIGANFIDSNDLTISVDGGSGGPGENGTDGKPGTSDTECPLTLLDKIDPFSYCSHYNFIHFETRFNDGCSAESTVDDFRLEIKVIDYHHQRITCNHKSHIFFSSHGGDAGHGGKGGAGGYAGNITVIAMNKQFINLSNQVGKEGSDGYGGVGGEPGEAALKNPVLDAYTDYPRLVSFARSKSVETYLHGKDGINGHNTKNIKDPEKALSQPNFDHQSINDYKTFFRKYLSDNINDVDLINFLDFLEKF